MLDIVAVAVPFASLLDARGPPICGPAMSASHTEIAGITTKFGHGGARANSGGLRSPPGGRPRKSVSQMTAVDVPRWYCLRTDHRAEMLAFVELSHADVTVFAPMMWKPPEEMRRYTNGSVRQARPARLVPLFRRYIFVQLMLSDPSWHRIKDLPGIERFISSAASARGEPGLPIAIPDEAIASVRELLSPNGCLYPPSYHDAAIPAGTALHLTAGPFADRAAICRLSDGRRVAMLMQMFGREVVVTTRQSGVEVSK